MSLSGKSVLGYLGRWKRTKSLDVKALLARERVLTACRERRE